MADLSHLSPRSYRLIVADPPWDFKAGKKTRPQHYSRMSLADICAMPVRDLAHPEGCRLALWTTPPFLLHGAEVLRAWGFRYSTCRFWGKLWPSEDAMFIYADSLARGTGYEAIGNCEVLLIGKRGRPQGLGTKKPAGLFFARRRRPNHAFRVSGAGGSRMSVQIELCGWSTPGPSPLFSESYTLWRGVKLPQKLRGEVTEIFRILLRERLSVSTVISVLPHAFCKISERLRQHLLVEEPLDSWPQFSALMLSGAAFAVFSGQKGACRQVYAFSEHEPGGVPALHGEAGRGLIESTLDCGGQMFGRVYASHSRDVDVPVHNSNVIQACIVIPFDSTSRVRSADDECSRSATVSAYRKNLMSLHRKHITMQRSATKDVECCPIGGAPRAIGNQYHIADPNNYEETRLGLKRPTIAESVEGPL